MSDTTPCAACAARESEMPAGLGFVLGIALMAAIFALVEFNREDARSVRREAVKAGHAAWIAGDDGAPKFAWKDPR